MNLKRLLKAIGIVLLVLLIIAIFIGWVYLLQQNTWWLVGGIALLLLVSFVEYVYKNLED